MGNLAKFAVLVTTLTSLFAVMSITAGAVTWDNSGSTTFTATAGPSTLSSTGVAVSCSGATATGTAPNNVVGLTYAVSGTATFGGCLLSGISTSIDCGYAFTGTSQSGAVTSGNVDLTCGIYQFGQKICHLGGAVVGSYTNGTPGVLTLATGGSLRASNPPTGSCPWSTGDLLHMPHMTFRTTSANPPVITRTA
jgi:hypothetical protein